MCTSSCFMHESFRLVLQWLNELCVNSWTAVDCRPPHIEEVCWFSLCPLLIWRTSFEVPVSGGPRGVEVGSVHQESVTTSDWSESFQLSIKEKKRGNHRIKEQLGNLGNDFAQRSASGRRGTSESGGLLNEYQCLRCWLQLGNSVAQSQCWEDNAQSLRLLMSRGVNKCSLIKYKDDWYNICYIQQTRPIQDRKPPPRPNNPPAQSERFKPPKETSGIWICAQFKF